MDAREDVRKVYRHLPRRDRIPPTAVDARGVEEYMVTVYSERPGNMPFLHVVT